VQSGNDYKTLKIKNARYDSGYILPMQGFVPVEKQLLLASTSCIFLCQEEKHNRVAKKLGNRVH